MFLDEYEINLNLLSPVVTAFIAALLIYFILSVTYASLIPKPERPLAIQAYILNNLKEKYTPPFESIEITSSDNMTIYQWDSSSMRFYAEYNENQREFTVYLLFPSNLTRISPQDAYDMYGTFFKSNDVGWKCGNSTAAGLWSCNAKIGDGKALIVLGYKNTDTAQILYREKQSPAQI